MLNAVRALVGGGSQSVRAAPSPRSSRPGGECRSSRWIAQPPAPALLILGWQHADGTCSLASGGSGSILPQNCAAHRRSRGRKARGAAVDRSCLLVCLPACAGPARGEGWCPQDGEALGWPRPRRLASPRLSPSFGYRDSRGGEGGGRPWFRRLPSPLDGAVALQAGPAPSWASSAADGAAPGCPGAAISFGPRRPDGALQPKPNLI